MKAYYFSLCYLGGEVDLVKLRNHMAGPYTGMTLELVRGDHMANIPLSSGSMELGGKSVPYQIVCHQFDSGFGTVVFMLEYDLQEQAAATALTQQAIQKPEMAGAVLEYFNRVFGVSDAGELFNKLRKPEVRRQIIAGPGVNLLTVGLDNCNIGIHEFDCLWLAGGGGEEARKAGWRDLTAGRSQLLAGDTNRFWSPQAGGELYWDMVAILLREHSSSVCLEYTRSWLGALNQQLRATGESLRRGNEEVWSQDRDDIEAMDINFLGFNIHLKTFLQSRERLYRRDAPPASLRLIEPAEWETLSGYRSRRSMTDGLLAECKHTIERMTRPLDFREFRLLKLGVEEVEARIMLLTVLLVIMELFAQVLEPGHWHLKGAMLGLLVLIPGSFLLWTRLRRVRARRRGRTLYLRNLKAKAEEEGRGIDQQMMQLKNTPGISPQTLEYYLGIYGEIRKRVGERVAEIDSEIGDAK
jgi:hypothetical protein